MGSKGAKAHTRWKEVWRNTGANRPTRAEERDGEEEEEAFDEEAGEGTGTRECRRVGVAMAVRAGEMWELSEGRVWDAMEADERKQGCLACCGRERRRDGNG